jgi:hypothetical protein
VSTHPLCPCPAGGGLAGGSHWMGSQQWEDCRPEVVTGQATKSNERCCVPRHSVQNGTAPSGAVMSTLCASESGTLVLDGDDRPSAMPPGVAAPTQPEYPCHPCPSMGLSPRAPSHRHGSEAGKPCTRLQGRQTKLPRTIYPCKHFNVFSQQLCTTLSCASFAAVF